MKQNLSCCWILISIPLVSYLASIECYRLRLAALDLGAMAGNETKSKQYMTALFNSVDRNHFVIVRGVDSRKKHSTLEKFIDSSAKLGYLLKISISIDGYRVIYRPNLFHFSNIRVLRWYGGTYLLSCFIHTQLQLAVYFIQPLGTVASQNDFLKLLHDSVFLSDNYLIQHVDGRDALYVTAFLDDVLNNVNINRLVGSLRQTDFKLFYVNPTMLDILPKSLAWGASFLARTATRSGSVTLSISLIHAFKIGATGISSRRADISHYNQVQLLVDYLPAQKCRPNTDNAQPDYANNEYMQYKCLKRTKQQRNAHMELI